MSRARDTANLGGTDLATQVELDAVSVATAISWSTVKPHIRTGVLYPAVGGKGIDGSTTVTSFGTDFAITGYATLKYYYTDIKGSKPIKDPRIGAHFGSQRYKFKSLQLLEQETATHGSNVYSVDGREWLRAVGDYTQGNNDDGPYPINSASVVGFIEIVGYFSDANWIANNRTGTARGFVTSIDGGSDSSEDTTFETTADSPLGSRYVDRGSLANLNLPTTHSTSLGIHTLKVKENAASDTPQQYGIELIAQDTTSTATKSKIQIPAQDVVSYGEKFTVAAAAHHYNPFAFKTDGATAWDSGAHNGTAWPIGTGSSTNIDTATSLGLAAWVSTNYYKPYNGGRVVKWVASDGTIKTSVNMMPPNARNIGSTAVAEKGDDSAGTTSAAVANNTYLPTFTDQAIDHSQAEVAKTFHWREFGNGAANGGTGATYADASMLSSTADDIAYVMDDGLTSLSGDNADVTSTANMTDIIGESDGDTLNITFIGTGLTFTSIQNSPGIDNFVQNLPYGTHILKTSRLDSSASATTTIDGVSLGEPSTGSYGGFSEVTFHQPKLPPIPENACILADYMLMADYVANTSNGNHLISKGVRIVSHTRDILYDEVDAFVKSFYDTDAMPGMGYIASSSSTTNSHLNKYSLPAFGTTFQINGHTSHTNNDLFIDDGDVAQSGTASGDHGDISYPDAAVTLGLHKFAVHGNSTLAYSPYLGGTGFKIATPIHTSSHYQTFETPFLHELVGGDRNMEQTNLVVTPDGKTWDEVTRDVSYLGNTVLSAVSGVAGWTHDDEYWIFDEMRGRHSAHGDQFNKDFAIAYDRHICLKDGWYTTSMRTLRRPSSGHMYIKINGTIVSYMHYSSGPTYDMNEQHLNIFMKRGDYIQIYEEGHGSELSTLYITKHIR